MPVTITEESSGELNKPSGAVVIEEPEEEGILSSIGGAALQKVGEFGQFIDKYTGAPTRAAVHELQKDWKNVGGAAKKFGSQFGEDPNLAPTGKDIARYAGVTDESVSDVLPWAYSETGEGLPLKKGGWADPTASGVVGLGVDIAADPTNLIPGKAVSYAAKKAGPVLSKFATKTASTLSGLPEGTISTYAKNLPDINKAIKTYGQDIATASDDVRTGYASAIKNTRMKMNETISSAVKNMPDKFVSMKPTIDALENFKAGLNPKLHLDDIAQVDEMINSVKQLQDPMTGMVPLKDSLDIKEFLQERAKRSYQKSGQIFQPGTKSQMAAKQAAANARKVINESVPEIAQANNRLAMLHNLEDRMNKNLIGPGKPEGALMSAGAGTNPRGAKNLSALGDLTGTDMLGQAQKLSAQKTFSNPDWLPVDTTGKSLTRTLVAAGVGKLSGLPLAEYALPAAMSPAGVKGAVNLGSKVGELSSKLAPYSREAYLGASAQGRSQNEGVMGKLRGSKYEQLLNDASKNRGNEGYAATYYLLQQTDPEFRRLLENNEGQ